MDFSKSQKEIQTIKHEFLVVQLLLTIKEQDVTNFNVVEQMIEQTIELINKHNEEKTNIIDNNIFELQNLLDDFKFIIEDVTGNIYLLLLNNHNDYLLKLLSLIKSLTLDYPIKLVKLDLIRYFKKIINDYFINLKYLLFEANKALDTKALDHVMQIITQDELSQSEMLYIYKEAKSIIKFIMENQLETNDLLDKYYLFELAFIIKMVA